MTAGPWGGPAIALSCALAARPLSLHPLHYLSFTCCIVCVYCSGVDSLQSGGQELLVSAPRRDRDVFPTDYAVRAAGHRPPLRVVDLGR